jgi:predicted NAD-dependent protein-ADP-ribosyltransferase YbiA (DUF1768 family)
MINFLVLHSRSFVAQKNIFWRIRFRKYRVQLCYHGNLQKFLTGKKIEQLILGAARKLVLVAVEFRGAV